MLRIVTKDIKAYEAFYLDHLSEAAERTIHQLLGDGDRDQGDHGSAHRLRSSRDDVVLQLLWLALPIIMAGLVHLAVMKLDLLPACAGCRSTRAQLIAAGACLATTRPGAAPWSRSARPPLAAWVLAQLSACCWSLPTLVALGGNPPAGVGTAARYGYIVGELPNSFAKRRLDIAPGAAGQGTSGRAFWIIDQLDSLAGMLLFIAPVWRPSLGLLALIVAIMLVATSGERLVMMRFGLKDRVG